MIYYFVIGHIPVIPLNYSVLSNEGPYSRDLLQLCIKEILLAMSRCLFAKRNVHLDFYEVGRVIIKDSKVQMKFFRSFINQLDCSGELANSFRPVTAQSVVSIMTNPRSSTSSGYILPRYYYSKGLIIDLTFFIPGCITMWFPVLIHVMQLVIWMVMETVAWKRTA